MKKQLKEKWDEIAELIEKKRDLLNNIKERIHRIEINIDYAPCHEKIVDEWWHIHPDCSYPIYTDENGIEWWEAICLVVNCIAEYCLDKYGRYFSNDTSDEIESGDAERWFAEIISYSVQIQALRESYVHAEKNIKSLEEQQQTIIKPYKALYENACDDLYYGYGYNTWYNGTADVNGAKEYFESEEDAKFIWHLAFEKMANDNKY